MAKSLIRNNTQAPLALPLPYSGVLAAGEGTVVEESATDVVAALFDDADKTLRNTYTVTQVNDRSKTGRGSRRETARKIGLALDASPVDLGINGVRLRRVGLPTLDNDAATKGYVDSVRAGLQAELTAIPTWFYGERYFELGDATTGIWHVTVAARAARVADLDEIGASKHASSEAGPLGTFAVRLDNPVGVAIQSVTLFTYTSTATQPRIVLMMNNPQGARPAHRFVRPAVVQFPPSNAQESTPMVSVAGADGQMPSRYGVTGQLDPAALYPAIRIVATGFFAAVANTVADRFFNKPQSLVVQF